MVDRRQKFALRGMVFRTWISRSADAPSMCFASVNQCRWRSAATTSLRAPAPWRGEQRSHPPHRKSSLCCGVAHRCFVLGSVPALPASWQGAAAPYQCTESRLADASCWTSTRHAAPGGALRPVGTSRQIPRIDRSALWVRNVGAPGASIAPGGQALPEPPDRPLRRFCWSVQHIGCPGAVIAPRAQGSTIAPEACSVVMLGRQSFLDANPTSPLSPIQDSGCVDQPQRRCYVIAESGHIISAPHHGSKSAVALGDCLGSLAHRG